MSDPASSEPAPTSTQSLIPTECPTEEFLYPGSKDILLIVYVSLALGISSFLCFCVWLSLLISISVVYVMGH